jgi:chromosome partitioning protein
MGEDSTEVIVDENVETLDDHLIHDVSFVEVEHTKSDDISDTNAKPRRLFDIPLSQPTEQGLARVVTVTNQKGGVGKTTSVINIATHLALRGARILVIDCDAQGNCASGLGVDKSRTTITTKDIILTPSISIQARHATAVEGLHLIVGDHNLVGVEESLASQLGRERRLVEALAPLRPHYDLILIDTAPSMSIVSVNALTASNGILIPVQTEYLALEGVALMMGTIQEIRRLLNKSLGIDAVIMTMHAPTLLNTQVAGHLREIFGNIVLEPPIRRNIRLAESPSQGVPIQFHAPQSHGGQDYSNLASELEALWFPGGIRNEG